MNARAIAPALALLMLTSTLPSTPARAQTAPPPAPVPTPGISDEKFYTESAQAGVEIVEEFGAYDNPAALARINRIGYELAQHTDFAKYPITFGLINMPEPNAEALPGGQIFVTRGMVEMNLDDDEWAIVLGHEMGHVIKEHYLHMARRAMLMSVLGNLLVAGVLISSAKNPPRTGVEGPYDPRYGYDPGGGNRVQGAAAASLLVSELVLRSYSREHEDEADQVGQRLAADAGYDPDGAVRMWKKMEATAPQTREYGYLQTHPFSQERIRSAEARKGSWSIQKRQSADVYRQHTQEILMAYVGRQRLRELAKPVRERQKPPEPGAEAPKPPARVTDLVTQMALGAWPKGKTADGIRLARLHKLRDSKLARCPDPTLDDYGVMGPQQAPDPRTPAGRRQGGAGGGGGGGDTSVRVSRLRGYQSGDCAPELHDYGAVIRAYRKELAEVQSLDPTGPTPPLVPALGVEIADLEAQRKALYPHAVEVFSGGVFETLFLVAFLSNFPDAPEVPQVALALGDAYSRTGNETEAVAQYLVAWKAAPDSTFGKRARAGLHNLTPSLKQLAALQELAVQDSDTEIKKLAGDRLATVSHTYDDVANGAEYMRRFPDGEYVGPVLDRLNVLADNLYGEVVLYQGFGDASKALDRINKILTNAPLSPAAEKLRDRAVLLAEKG